jgi:hypothetical protein
MIVSTIVGERHKQSTKRTEESGALLSVAALTQQKKGPDEASLAPSPSGGNVGSRAHGPLRVKREHATL